MGWRIEFETKALKELKQLDKPDAKRIWSYLIERVATRDDPRVLASPLSGQWGEYWRFRVGHYRVVCRMEEQELVVLVVRIGHRKSVYR